VANLEKQKTQKESQRLLQLARERLNPSKGEFGITETLGALKALIRGR